MKILLLNIILIVLLLGCVKETYNPSISGYYKMNDVDFWIEFNEGKIDAYSFVNIYSGTYNLEPLQIKITGTKVHETNGFNNVRDLRNITKFNRKNNKLSIYTIENVYHFTEVQNIY